MFCNWRNKAQYKFYNYKQKIMKKLLCIVCVICLFSCKKDFGKTCYDCEYAMVAGSQRPNDVRCTDDPNGPALITDSQGNVLSTFCVKRR